MFSVFHSAFSTSVILVLFTANGIVDKESAVHAACFGCSDGGGCGGDDCIANQYVCEDRSEHCARFGDLCENFYFRSCVRRACPRTCKLCPDNRRVPTPPTESSTPSTTTPFSSTTNGTSRSTSTPPSSVSVSSTTTEDPFEGLFDNFPSSPSPFDDDDFDTFYGDGSNSTTSSFPPQMNTTGTTNSTLTPPANNTTPAPSSSFSSSFSPTSLSTPSTMTSPTTTPPTPSSTTTGAPIPVKDVVNPEKTKCKDCDAKRAALKQLYDQYYPK